MTSAPSANKFIVIRESPVPEAEDRERAAPRAGNYPKHEVPNRKAGRPPLAFSLKIHKTGDEEWRNMSMSWK